MGLPQYVAILGFAALSRLVARLPPARLESVLEPRGVPRQHDPAEIERVAQRIERVLSRSEPVLRHHCLTRGLTRYFFLRRVGANVQLVFGIGEIDGRPHGHCWLLRDGMLYHESSDPEQTFTAVYSLPSR